MRGFLLLLISIYLFPGNAPGQASLELWKHFWQQDADVGNWKDHGTPCPWQSVRFNVEGYQTFQIDIKGTEAELLELDLQEVKDNLEQLYMGSESISLRTKFEVDFHTSAPYRPFAENYRPVSYLEGWTEDTQEGGWTFHPLQSINMIYGMTRDPDGLYRLSFPFWMKYPGNAIMFEFYIIDQLPDTIPIWKP